MCGSGCPPLWSSTCLQPWQCCDGRGLIEPEAIWLIALVQLAAALGYLLYVMRFFARIRPLIVTTRREWRDDVLP